MSLISCISLGRSSSFDIQHPRYAVLEKRAAILFVRCFMLHMGWWCQLIKSFQIQLSSSQSGYSSWRYSTICVRVYQTERILRGTGCNGDRWVQMVCGYAWTILSACTTKSSIRRGRREALLNYVVLHWRCGAGIQVVAEIVRIVLWLLLFLINKVDR